MSDLANENVKDTFKGMCEEALPLLIGLDEILEKYGVKKIASIALSADGYINFSVHDENWSLTRIDKESKTRIRYEYSETIEI